MWDEKNPVVLLSQHLCSPQDVKTLIRGPIYTLQQADPDMQEVLSFWKQKCDLTILETNFWRLRHAGSFLKWTVEYFNDEKCFQQVLNSCTHL